MSTILNNFVYLQKLQVEHDGKPWAIIEKSGIIALYDNRFSQVYNSLNLIYDFYILNAQYTFLGYK